MDDLLKAHHEANEPPVLPSAASDNATSTEMTPMRLWPDQGK